MRYIAREARTSSQGTFFYGTFNIDMPVLTDQQELSHKHDISSFIQNKKLFRIFFE